MDWSKSFETYLNLSDKQRLAIGKKANDILQPEIDNLTDENIVKPTLYLMSVSYFLTGQNDEIGQKEYLFFRDVTGYNECYNKFLETIEKGKNDKLSKYVQVYFQKLGGDVLTAYLSLGLALLTIKGELSEADKELVEKLREQ